MSGRETEGARGARIATGFGIGVGLHLIFQGLFYAIAYPIAAGRQDSYAQLTALMGVFAIGLSQLVYILPAVAIAYWKGRAAIGQGLLLLAALTFLLNAGCFGLLA